jgi:hypothetical protein
MHPFNGVVDLSRLARGPLGQPPAPQDTGIADILDSEVLALEKVLQALQGRTAVSRRYEAFEREIHQRFNEVGFIVDVKWFETNVPDHLIPEVTVTGRIDGPKEFDHDQMRHEVVSDILELGEGGVISGAYDKAQRSAAEKHKH